jgi:HNH endonuclease
MRAPGTKRDGTPFDDATIEAVWQKAKQEPIPGFRKDSCGASIQRSKYGKTQRFGWEIDHIKPVSKGGTDELANLQPLLWENNRAKGDEWPKWECKVQQ